MILAIIVFQTKSGLLKVDPLSLMCLQAETKQIFFCQILMQTDT